MRNAKNTRIYVSHRIDLKSRCVGNSVYLPVWCGAVFAQNERTKLTGDNSGENISLKRDYYSEFTVQYWAWKNQVNDYYGLCHYRRYLSFSKRNYKVDDMGMVTFPLLSKYSERKFGLCNCERINRIVTNHDVIVSEYADVTRIPTPKGCKKTVRSMWEAYDGVFFEKKVIDVLLELIDQISPQYSKSAREYLAGNKHRGYNCYILKRELFYRLCEFQFPIMFEMEKRIDVSKYEGTMKRTIAFMGEIMYGIFIYHISNYEQWKIKELQLVFFDDTAPVSSKSQVLFVYLEYYIKKIGRWFINPVMPLGSKRREVFKNIMYAITPFKRKNAINAGKK